MRRASTLGGLFLAVMAVRAGGLEDLSTADDCQAYLVSRPTAETAAACRTACVPAVTHCFQLLDGQRTAQPAA